MGRGGGGGVGEVKKSEKAVTYGRPLAPRLKNCTDILHVASTTSSNVLAEGRKVFRKVLYSSVGGIVLG